MLTFLMLTALNLAHPFETESDGRWPTPRPFLPIRKVNQVRNSVFGYQNDLSVGFGGFRAVAGMFDDPSQTVSQWHSGSFENPPGAILDFITMSRFEVSVKAGGFGLSISDTATLERGQFRSSLFGVEGFVTSPENVSELDNQCIYRNAGGNSIRTFRHPSWSLLCSSNVYGSGFDSSTWKSFGTYNASEITDETNKSIQIQWQLSDVVSYHAGLRKWRAPLEILVRAINVPGGSAPFNEWDVLWYEASGYLFDAESIGAVAFSELTPIPLNYRPFPTPPEIQFTPLEFVEDFLPFERL